MKSTASLIVTVVVLAAIGTVLWFASESESRVAAAEYALVTLRYERAAAELDAARGRGVLEPLIQRIGGAGTDSAVARYWSGDYEAFAETEDPRLKRLATDADYIARIGLAKHLSPTRSNGLAALLEFIRKSARESLAAA